MNVFDYIDQNDLNTLVTDGLVSARKHPEAPLTILNYTKHGAVVGDWSIPTFRKCRGLIYNHDTLEIVAIPWEKFFNYGDSKTGEIPDTHVVVTNKMDGSLGILYHTPDGRKWVASRGSFTSDMALHATEWLRTNMADWDWPEGITPLVEIIYPENRIVLNYGSKDSLVLLGGTSALFDQVSYVSANNTRDLLAWPGEVTETFSAETLVDALALPPRENAEGVVVWFSGTHTMVKIKQEDYLRLHRVLFNLSNKAIWEQMIASPTFETNFEKETLDLLPADVQDWIWQTEDNYYEQANEIYGVAMHHLERFTDLELSPDYHKRVALSVKDFPPPLRNAVLMQMRNGFEPEQAMRKILYGLGYGAFTRPQNVNGEEEE